MSYFRRLLSGARAPEGGERPRVTVGNHGGSRRERAGVLDPFADAASGSLVDEGSLPPSAGVSSVRVGEGTEGQRAGGFIAAQREGGSLPRASFEREGAQGEAGALMRRELAQESKGPVMRERVDGETRSNASSDLRSQPASAELGEGASFGRGRGEKIAGEAVEGSSRSAGERGFVAKMRQRSLPVAEPAGAREFAQRERGLEESPSVALSSGATALPRSKAAEEYPVRGDARPKVVVRDGDDALPDLDRGRAAVRRSTEARALVQEGLRAPQNASGPARSGAGAVDGEDASARRKVIAVREEEGAAPRRTGESHRLRAESMEEAMSRVKAWLRVEPPTVSPRESDASRGGARRMAAPEGGRGGGQASSARNEGPGREAPVELSIGAINVTIEERAPTVAPPSPTPTRRATVGREERETGAERRSERLARHYLRGF